MNCGQKIVPACEGAEFNLIPYTYVLNGATSAYVTNTTLPIPDGATDITYADPLKKITVNGVERSVEKAIKRNANALVMQIVDLGTFLITAALSSGASSMSVNMQLGLNALRCAFLNGFSNADKLVEAAIYAAWQFGQFEMLQDYLNDYYGYLCTCQKDKEQISEMLGATGQSMKNFGACGEGEDTQVQAS